MQNLLFWWKKVKHVLLLYHILLKNASWEWPLVSLVISFTIHNKCHLSTILTTLNLCQSISPVTTLKLRLHSPNRVLSRFRVGPGLRSPELAAARRVPGLARVHCINWSTSYLFKEVYVSENFVSMLNHRINSSLNFVALPNRYLINRYLINRHHTQRAYFCCYLAYRNVEL